jgi:hypothetical protein
MGWLRAALDSLTPLSRGSSRQVEVPTELELSETPGLSPYLDIGRYRPEHRFLSRMDRDYIRALLATGYPEEAADLVQKAYRAGAQPPTGERPLLTIYDLEYIEMLLIVGRRRMAVDFVLHLMEEYELTSGVRLAETTRSRLDREYETTMTAIDIDGRLPPEDFLDGSKERGGNILRRLLDVLLG